MFFLIILWSPCIYFFGGILFNSLFTITTAGVGWHIFTLQPLPLTPLLHPLASNRAKQQYLFVLLLQLEVWVINRYYSAKGGGWLRAEVLSLANWINERWINASFALGEARGEKSGRERASGRRGRKQHRPLEREGKTERVRELVRFSFSESNFFPCIKLKFPFEISKNFRVHSKNSLYCSADIKKIRIGWL